MKKLVKMILVAIPALVVAAAVGTTTIGCGDDSTSTTGNDMAMHVGGDMSHGTTGGMDMTQHD
jgi:hypothetical protein